jgi:hypothetical protein
LLEDFEKNDALATEATSEEYEDLAGFERRARLVGALALAGLEDTYVSSCPLRCTLRLPKCG